MGMTPFSVVGTASTVLALSKAAWKLGISLMRLDHDTHVVNSTVKDLAGDLKSLAYECDLMYAELEELVSNNEADPPPRCEVDDALRDCFATQVQDVSQTMEELEVLIRKIRDMRSISADKDQQQKIAETSKDPFASFRTKTLKHTETLRITALLITTTLAHLAPHRADRGLVRKLNLLQDMVEKLQKLHGDSIQSQSSHVDAYLIHYTHEVIAEGKAIYEKNLAAQHTTRDKEGTGCPTPHVHRLSVTNPESLGLRLCEPSDTISVTKSPPAVTVTTLPLPTALKHDNADIVRDSSDDDLDIDLFRTALDSGTKAFEAHEWEEAGGLLQEGIGVLQQLSRNQQKLCDVFGLQYKLAVCAFHTREPADAERALLSLTQQTANSNEQHVYINDATHLLSLLHVRVGHLDRAQAECEKALQARRKLLGKLSDATLESMVLMAHIYFMLNNPARAKLYLATIPEARRPAVVAMVERSLGARVQQLNSPSLTARSVSGGSDMTVEYLQNRLSASSVSLPPVNHRHSSIPAMNMQSSAASDRQSHHQSGSTNTGLDSRSCATVTSPTSTEKSSDSRIKEKNDTSQGQYVYPEAVGAVARSPPESSRTTDTTVSNPLSRTEILDKIGCQPRDRIEEAVCKGEYSAFLHILSREKSFWRSRVRKHVRPERVTALHFAALFGEVDMAQRLLGSGFEINEIPYGYSTNFTPLKFAVGARQVDMVEFLISNGARPSEPDSWSTLAGQLMNRSWLLKTMSDTDKEHVSYRIMAILKILIRRGWDVNTIYDKKSGDTLLHQAVTFWTGSYKWDLSLRATMTSFLCGQGANPLQANVEGKTAYDMALASGHQDLMQILDRGLKNRGADEWATEPIELST